MQWIPIEKSNLSVGNWAYPAADAWHQFVSRALQEENLAYSLDAQCGVHYLVDEKFERNRVSVIRTLADARYAGVRDAFEAAHSYLDNQPPDTKASVRSTFEAVEILAKLIAPGSVKLDKELVRVKLKPLVLRGSRDAIEARTVGKLLDGLVDWVDGLHNYRRGAGVEEPVEPPLALAVYSLSTGAAIIRWLVTVDQESLSPLK